MLQPECGRAALPRGFHLLIATQFFSALADNALLIVTIALLDERGLPMWWAPLLKLGFTLSYVLLAPFVGALADAVPKRRLMAWMNAAKIIGALALLTGLHPVAAFVIVGFGAAGYAPAKYGLITELVGPQQLVRANGWLEVSVVCAALLGAMMGGLLVSPWWLGSSWHDAMAATLDGSYSRYLPSLLMLLLVYAASSLLNLGVPASGARYPACAFHPMALQREFMSDQRALWRDADGGLSLAVTTIFWGLGATLQFAVLRWASDVLLLPLNQAAYLQAAVAVGGGTGSGRRRTLGAAGRGQADARLWRDARALDAGAGHDRRLESRHRAAGAHRRRGWPPGGAAQPRSCSIAASSCSAPDARSPCRASTRTPACWPCWQPMR